MSTPTTPGRRSAARRTRLNVTTVLAVVLPVLCVLALALVQTTQTEPGARPPVETTLTRSTLVCPSAAGDDTDLSLTTTAADVDGTVSVGLGGKGDDQSSEVDLASDRVRTVEESGAVAVTGAGDTAPGLVAARVGGEDLVSGQCLPPVAREWFAGIGSGAGHTSVLELTNPDGGTALADITVLGGNGVVDAPRLRGVSVPGHSTVRLELAKLIPSRGSLALELATVRGRLGASLVDRYDRIGSSPATQDWLPGQVEPATTNLLMGLATGTGRRVLTIANGGDDEARVDLRVITSDAVFAPEGVDTIRVGPQSVKRVTLTSVLTASNAQDALGLELTSSAPVSAALRSQAGEDLSHAVPGAQISSGESATGLLPEGQGQGAGATEKSVEIAGATRSGTVMVVSRSADGKRLDRSEVDVVPDQGARVDVPAEASLVTLTPSRTSITATVLVTRTGGATVVPLVVPVTSGLVPAVRPGLP